MPKVCRNPGCPDADDDGIGGEFRDDIDVCPRCGGALESSTPPSGGGAPGHGGGRSAEHAVDLVELVVAQDPTEAMMIEGLLSSTGIHYLMTDPLDVGFGGWGRIIIGPGSFVGRVRFVVAADDLEQARGLVAPHAQDLDPQE